MNPNRNMPVPIDEQLKGLECYFSGDGSCLNYSYCTKSERDAPVIHFLVQKSMDGGLFVDVGINNAYDEIDVAVLVDAVTNEMLNQLEARYADDEEEDPVDSELDGESEEDISDSAHADAVSIYKRTKAMISEMQEKLNDINEMAERFISRWGE